MIRILSIGLCLATCLYSGINATVSSTSTPELVSIPPFDIDKELIKIVDTCLTHRELEEMAGNIVRYQMAKLITVNSVLEAHDTIGLNELRSMLGFPPLGSWKKYWQPSKEEIANATTIQEYYELKEPRSEMRSLDSSFFLEKNVLSAIAFLDKRFPSIHTIYRKKFEEIRDAKKTIDREEIDLLIQKFSKISSRLDTAFTKMHIRSKRCLLEKKNGSLDD